jgi:RNA polymerase sigma factor (sigma-70 family)
MGGRQDHMHRYELSAADADQVHRFVAQRVANPADAADIAQQTLLLAWAKLGTCRGKSVSAWMLAIARHQIVDHYRAHNRFHFVEAAAVAETEPSLRTPPDRAQAICEHHERLRCWTDCIRRRLQLEEQVAVLLADVYGLRDKESAAVLCMSLPCFKLLLHGARARLHEIADGECWLARKTSAVHGNGGRPSEHPTHRVGVTCRLGAPKLLALRTRLMDGLRL